MKNMQIIGHVSQRFQPTPENAASSTNNTTAEPVEVDTEKIILQSFTIFLFFGTISLVLLFNVFKNWQRCPMIIRSVLRDIGVMFAISLMVGVDLIANVGTPKLMVPNQFQPSNPSRGWIINPFSARNPPWTWQVALIPALLVAILIFLNQQLSTVIINRKDNKLKVS